MSAPLTAANSFTLPAYFSMKLSKPTVICLELIEKLTAITELPCADISTAKPIFSLIASQMTGGKVQAGSSKPLFVVI